MFLDKEDINYQAAHMAKNVRLDSDSKERLLNSRGKKRMQRVTKVFGIMRTKMKKLMKVIVT